MSSKGQITVPIELREELGLETGTVVQFELRDGALILRKGTGTDHPVDRLFGHLKLNRPVDEILDQMRGPRPAQDKRKTVKRR